jgi:hypothetical protein
VKAGVVKAGAGAAFVEARPYLQSEPELAIFSCARYYSSRLARTLAVSASN